MLLLIRLVLPLLLLVQLQFTVTDGGAVPEAGAHLFGVL
jgi:hypothetical protein